MTELDDKLLKLKNELYSDPAVVEYFRLKKLIESDESLNLLDKEIKELQRKVCSEVHESRDSKDADKLNELLQKFNSNPVIINYNKLYLEVKDLLKEISDTLEK